MTLKRFILFIGILSIIISLATWTMDFMHLVIECMYCRMERTMIGLLGALLLLPTYPHVIRYLAYVLGFFGASVAAQQIMIILTKGALFPFELPLASAVMFWCIGQVFLLELRKSVYCTHQV
jgi:hypothetical protein